MSKIVMKMIFGSQLLLSSFMKRILLMTMLATALSVTLSGCGGGGGGGGGDDSSTPSVNTAPIARAGDAKSVTTGTLVTLDGSASNDANGDPLTYSWGLYFQTSWKCRRSVQRNCCQTYIHR